MEEIVDSSDGVKHETVKRPMNAFLIFCKRHRALVHQKNPSLDNRSVTRILGDLWANLGPDKKYVYTDLAKQYKEAFLKANPDYRWYNPEKHAVQVTSPGGKSGKPPFPLSASESATQASEGISPGKLADPSNMGGLSMLLMAGQQTFGGNGQAAIYDAISLPQTVAADLAKTEATTSSPERNLHHRTELSSDQKEGVTPSSSAIKSFGKFEPEESFSIRKRSTELPIDLSQASDIVRNCATSALCRLDRFKDEVSDARALSSSVFNGGQTILKSSHEKHLEDTTGATLQHPLACRDSFTVNNSSGPECASMLPLKSDSNLPVIRLGSDASASTSSAVQCDQKTVKSAGNPLMYLFSQPAHLMPGWPGKAIITPAGVQTEPSCRGAVKPTEFSEFLPSSVKLIPPIVAKLSGGVNSLAFDGSRSVLENFSTGDLQQLVMGKVIESAYAKELKQESGGQSFPKTKKQLAVDKFSSATKNTAFCTRNGNCDTGASLTDISLPCMAACLGSNGIQVADDQTCRDKTSAAEEKKLESVDVSEKTAQTVEMSDLTIAQISEKLIMKVVQEEELHRGGSPLSGESRFPLKLPKKTKNVDDVRQSSSTVHNSSPSKSSAGFHIDTSNGHLIWPANIFSSLVEKTRFSTTREQNPDALMNSNLFINDTGKLCSSSVLPASNQSFCLANAPTSIGNGLLSTNSSSGHLCSVFGPGQIAVNKLIDTIIAGSFAGLDSAVKTTRACRASSSRALSSDFEGNRPAYERENGADERQSSRRANDTKDEIKTQKRKRSRKTDSSERFRDGSALLQTVQKTDFKDTVAGLARSDPTDGFDLPKRLKESTVSTAAKDFGPEIPNAAFDFRTNSNESAALKLSGASRLIDSILNEGVTDASDQQPPRGEEINNNRRQKAMRNVGHDALMLTNRALRKSKRANQGLRYKELLSKGVLYTSRKSTDCNNLNENNREDVTMANDFEVTGNDFDATFLADSTLADVETDVSGRRYKSGDFDLEAHIASLPACQIEVTDRKSSGKIKSRSYSQSQSSVPASLPVAQNQPYHRNSLNPDKVGNGADLERICFSRLRSLARLLPTSRNHRLGSCRRKNRTYCIFQILPLSQNNCKTIQMTGASDENVLSLSSVFTSVPPSDSQQISSVSHQVDSTVELNEVSRDDQNFHVLADAAAVSSDQ